MSAGQTVHGEKFPSRGKKTDGEREGRASLMSYAAQTCSDGRADLNKRRGLPTGRRANGSNDGNQTSFIKKESENEREKVKRWANKKEVWKKDVNYVQKPDKHNTIC